MAEQGKAVTKKAAAPAAPAKAKGTTPQGSPESIAQRKTTRALNSTLDIDYGAPRDEDSFPVSGRTSFWVHKLNKLGADCADEDSPAEYGQMYQIGSFGTTSTAQSTLKRITTGHVNELVGVFSLKAERTANGSALWAAAIEPESDEPEAEAGEDGEGEAEWETTQTPVAGDDGDE